MDRLPVHESSAVNGHCLRFEYRATPNRLKVGRTSVRRVLTQKDCRPYRTVACARNRVRLILDDRPDDAQAASDICGLIL